MSEPHFFESAAEWRAWLEAHHERETEVWVGMWRKALGRGMTWSEAVDEALCFGWIDSVAKRVDEDRRMQRFSPRKPASNWSLVNVRKVEALRAAGKMRPAGEAAFARRRADRTGVYSFEREAAALAPEQQAQLEANPAAWAYWQSRPPGYRRTATHWVVSAKREETRARRLAALIEDCAAGRPIKPLRRPE